MYGFVYLLSASTGGTSTLPALHGSNTTQQVTHLTEQKLKERQPLHVFSEGRSSSSESLM